MKKKPETPPPEDSLKKLADLTRRVLQVPKDAISPSRATTDKKQAATKKPLIST